MLQEYVEQKFSDVQTKFKKGRGTRDQIANSYWNIEKANNFTKTSTSASLTMLKPLTVWITTNCLEKSERNGSIRPPYLSPEKAA